MKRANEKIRLYAQKNGVYMWQLAHKLGVTPETFSKQLRFEFSEEETNKVLNIINELSEENK